jgi:hypothetical protein
MMRKGNQKLVSFFLFLIAIEWFIQKIRRKRIREKLVSCRQHHIFAISLSLWLAARLHSCISRKNLIKSTFPYDVKIIQITFLCITSQCIISVKLVFFKYEKRRFRESHLHVTSQHGAVSRDALDENEKTLLKALFSKANNTKSHYPVVNHIPSTSGFVICIHCALSSLPFSKFSLSDSGSGKKTKQKNLHLFINCNSAPRYISISSLKVYFFDP